MTFVEYIRSKNGQRVAIALNNSVTQDGFQYICVGMLKVEDDFVVIDPDGNEIAFLIEDIRQISAIDAFEDDDDDSPDETMRLIENAWRRNVTDN